MQHVLLAAILAACSMSAAMAKESGNSPAPAQSGNGAVESYVEVPMPPGFHVEASALDGPVFADDKGHTLYTWPSKRLRNGYSGDRKSVV